MTFPRSVVGANLGTFAADREPRDAPTTGAPA
jgi:hypothetical protein